MTYSFNVQYFGWTDDQSKSRVDLKHESLYHDLGLNDFSLQSDIHFFLPELMSWHELINDKETIS